MRSRAALAFALALVAATACGRKEEARRATQQLPATRVPMPPKAESAGAPAQAAGAQPAPDTMTKAAPEPAKRPAAPPGPAETLYTVQIAAFANADTARSWAGRLSSQGLPVWTTTYQLHGRTFHRVRVGAVPTVAEARKLGEMLEKRYSWSFWVAPIGAADEVPAGAVEATRRILTG